MSSLEKLQLFIHGALAADPYFSDVGLYLLRPRRLADGSYNTLAVVQDQINRTLQRTAPTGGKAGAAITVLMPVIIADEKNRGLDTVTTIVRCQELPTVNMGPGGTRKSAEDLGEQAINTLLGLVLHGVAQELFFDKQAMVWVESNDPFWTYEVYVRTHLTRREADRVALPRITVTGVAPDATATITCGTADAAIYYTINAGYPSASNASAVLYTGEFPVTQAGDLYAAAYLDGSANSPVAHADIDGSPSNTALSEDGHILYSEDGSVLLHEA